MFVGSTRRFVPFLWAVMCFVLFLALASASQRLSGAYQADFSGSYSDEAAHYVTGLLLLHYLGSGLGQNPMAFAQDFYLHYPKVGLGHWPPFFYMVEAVWMQIFSVSRVSIFIFVATITSGLAVWISVLTYRSYGWLGGAMAGIAFISLPIIQQQTSSLMLDVPTALLIFCAAAFYAGYLKAPSWRFAAAFGISSGLAILTKGNALCLVFLPVCSLLITRRWNLLLRVDFWLPVPIVIVLVAPWYLLNLDNASDGFMYKPGLDYTASAIVFNLSALIRNLGWVGFALAIFAVHWTFMANNSQERPSALLSCMSALLLSVLVFQCLAPADLTERYIAPALPPAMLMALHGLRSIVRRLEACFTTQSYPLAKASVLAFLVGLIGINVAFAPPKQKPHIGMVEAASAIFNKPDISNPLILVGSGPRGEGALIAEVARRDRSGRYFVLRGTQVLGSGNFLGTDYASRFSNSSDLIAELSALGVATVVIDTSSDSRQFAHNKLLLEAAVSAQWSLADRFAHREEDGETLIYNVSGNEQRAVDKQVLANALGFHRKQVR
jgi:hypothetical protein